MPKMKDLLLQAYNKAGKEPPQPAKRSDGSKVRKPEKTQKTRIIHKPRSGTTTQGTGKKQPVVVKPPRHETKPLQPSSPFNVPVIRTVKPPKKESRKKPAQPREPRMAATVPFGQQFTISLSPDARPSWTDLDGKQEPIAILPHWRSPVPRHSGVEEIELSLGLDFGTSTVKVIIGDKAQQKAFAVPFLDLTDSNRYLLPSRLFLTGGVASLQNGKEEFSDLKMRLLDNMDSRDNQIRTALFLALVIRHSINWLFVEYESLYVKTAVAWRLAVGFPSTHLDQNESAYHLFIQTAWLLAHSSNSPTTALAGAAYDSIKSKLEKERGKNVIGIDYAIVPELAAQIFGYVSSDGFDPHDQKAFLLVDVGAGTVDAAVFRATRNRGKTKYDFFTATVEPNGVNMLHRNRLSWWKKVFHDGIAHRPELRQSIDDEMTKGLSPPSLPATLDDYFSDTSVAFLKAEYNPDEVFFKAFRRQVVTQTLFQAHNDGHWDKQELLDIPFYLCGGGSRVAIYQRLRLELSQRHFGMTWLKASPKQIEVPRNLVAPFLAKQDYDRLTVAYGLSFDEVGMVLKHPPKSPSNSESGTQHRPWWDSYIEK